MIEYYQEYLNRCIDIQEGRRILEVNNKIKNFMKSNLEILKGNNGKHAQNSYVEELQDVIKRKDREIEDIKIECAEQFKQIQTLCFCNNYNNKLDTRARLVKIEEIAGENADVLLKDIAIEDDAEGQDKIKSTLDDLGF